MGVGEGEAQGEAVEVVASLTWCFVSPKDVSRYEYVEASMYEASTPPLKDSSASENGSWTAWQRHDDNDDDDKMTMMATTGTGTMMTITATTAGPR